MACLCLRAEHLRAGDSGGGSSGSPRCVTIFRIGPVSVMKAMRRMSPRQFGHSSGNSFPALRPEGLAQRGPPLATLCRQGMILRSRELIRPARPETWQGDQA